MRRVLSVLSALTAVVLGALLLPHHAGVLVGLGVAGAVLAALSALLLTGHRRGVLLQPRATASTEDHHGRPHEGHYP